MAFQAGRNNLNTLVTTHNLKTKDLKKVLKNHNTTLRSKTFKLGMKKEDLLNTIAKEFKWRVMGTGDKKRIAFLHKGKQSSFRLNPTGTTRRTAEDAKEAQEKVARKAKAKQLKEARAKKKQKEVKKIAQKVKLAQAAKRRYKKKTK